MIATPIQSSSRVVGSSSSLKAAEQVMADRAPPRPSGPPVSAGATASPSPGGSPKSLVEYRTAPTSGPGGAGASTAWASSTRRADRVAPGDRAPPRARRTSGEPLELPRAASSSPMRAPRAEIIARRGQHHLCAGQRRRPGRPPRPRGHPASARRCRSPAARSPRRSRAPRRPAPRRARPRSGISSVASSWWRSSQQQAAVGDAQRVQLIGVPRSKRASRYSRKREWQRITRPSARQLTGRCRARRRASRSPALVSPSAAARAGTDLVEQRRRHQEVTVARVRAGRGCGAPDSRAAGPPRRPRRRCGPPDRHASNRIPVTQPPVASTAAPASMSAWPRLASASASRA